jgi:arginine/lysine/ornithine decarboxylase
MVKYDGHGTKEFHYSDKPDVCGEDDSEPIKRKPVRDRRETRFQTPNGPLAVATQLRATGPGRAEARVAEDERMLAGHYGFDDCVLGATGTTGFAHLLMTALPDDVTLLPFRDCDRAWFDAAFLRGREVRCVTQTYDARTDAFGPPSAKALRRALARTPGPAAAIVTSTTANGTSVPLEELSEVVTAHHPRSVLIADARHEALFDSHPGLPASARRAQIVVLSPHRTACAWPGASILGWRGDRAGALGLRVSYEAGGGRAHSRSVTASVAPALRALASRPDSIGRCIELAARTERMIAAAGTPVVSLGAAADVDPTRLNLDLTSLPLTGFELRTRLSDHGVLIEGAGLRTLRLFVRLDMDERDGGRLVEALKRSIADAGRSGTDRGSPPADPFATLDEEPAISIATARRLAARGAERLPLAAASGQVSCQRIGVRDVATPLVLPGFRIAPGAVRYLELAAEAGEAIDTPGGWTGDVAVAPRDFLTGRYV